MEEDSPSGTDMPSNHGWPIAISKGVRKCTKNKLYPIGNFVSYNIISPEYNRIIQELMTVSIPKNVREAMASAEWKQAMNEEMEALKKNDTWEMGPLPIGKKAVGSHWVFTTKYHSDGSIAQYKSSLGCGGIYSILWHRLCRNIRFGCKVKYNSCTNCHCSNIPMGIVPI